MSLKKWSSNAFWSISHKGCSDNYGLTDWKNTWIEHYLADERSYLFVARIFELLLRFTQLLIISTIFLYDGRNLLLQDLSKVFCHIGKSFFFFWPVLVIVVTICHCENFIRFSLIVAHPRISSIWFSLSHSKPNASLHDLAGHGGQVSCHSYCSLNPG